ncbi:hypothetical protein Plec18170_009703 [Paecilomyces lecythidis]
MPQPSVPLPDDEEYQGYSTVDSSDDAFDTDSAISEASSQTDVSLYSPSFDDDSSEDLFDFDSEIPFEYDSICGLQYSQITGTTNVTPDDLELSYTSHLKWYSLNGYRLFLSPLSETTPRRVLDVGCGRGAWAIDVADRYPHWIVDGFDAADVIPQWVPPNCDLYIDDCNKPFAIDSCYDLIHVRSMSTAVTNWDKFIQDCLTSLQPGGYVEVKDILVTEIAGSEDITRWINQVNYASRNLGVDLRSMRWIAEIMKSVGFEDITISECEWSSDEGHIRPSIRGCSLKLLTFHGGMTEEEAEVYTAYAVRDIKRVPVVTVHGRKPVRGRI